MTSEAATVDFHFGLSLETLETRCTISAVGRSRKDCFDKQHHFDVDTPYFRIFRLADDDIGMQMREWARSCGVVTDDANQLVRDVGLALGELFKPEGSSDDQ